ncbi:hypothetical protein C5B42_05800 [Candidatus Cerribacteria bacterium 'Amazon FNV 2010 28 9']|uniref:Uncharacterized protein n=1 Tax=Candidatus Cerribacteria bacterium 'Amazon FNV 2010 28 9' TaxID=2081795 RepID=A0A317JMF7_9BACT|nr:MAG: hypothetical protein C5B42_05800 [Candidatus Cerribacteria bacterium 'Amazon FNV 2010 28 9']
MDRKRTIEATLTSLSSALTHSEARGNGVEAQQKLLEDQIRIAKDFELTPKEIEKAIKLGVQKALATSEHRPIQ